MLRMIVIAALTSALLNAAPGLAGQRTFVSSYGVDSNSCSLLQPCRAFAAAILLTDPNGEIVVLDSAGYGPVTVTKPASIIAPPGVYAGISVPTGQDGVVVNAGAGDRVVLRGLTINGQGGDHGVLVTAGLDIHIEDCTISNLEVAGIQINGGTAVHVSRSTIRGNAPGDGIHVAVGASDVFVDKTRIAQNETGIYVRGGRVTLENLTVEKNDFDGLLVFPGAPSTVEVTVENSLFAGNGGAGIETYTYYSGLIANVSISRTAALRNHFGGFVADATNGGTISLVVSASIASENFTHGLSVVNSTASVSGSVFSHNGRYGLESALGSVVRSHGNNAADGNVWGNTNGAITNVGLF